MATATTKGTGFWTSAPAKLNISLDIKGTENATGFHIVSSVMQTVSLNYPVSLRTVAEGRESIVGCPTIHNILRKSIDELSKVAGEKLPCEIRVADTLLLGSGMGVDSSHAAAVLRLANVAFDMKLSMEQLHEVASRVGNDVQFALYGGRAQVEGGKHHHITPIPFPSLYYLIAKPEGVSLKTPLQYAMLDQTGKSLAQLARDASPLTDQLFNTTTGHEVEHGITGKGPTVFWGYAQFDEAHELIRLIQGVDGVSKFLAQPIPNPAINSDA